MTSLATIADLELRLGSTVAAEDQARTQALLDDASAAVRAYTGQLISAGTSTVTAFPRLGEVKLMQRPVTAVTSVTNADGDDVAYCFDGVDRLYGLAWPGTVTVDYAHGWASVPDDIIGVVCSIVQRSLTAAADPGITAESIAGYSYSRGPITASGPWGLFDQEKLVLRRYQRHPAAPLMVPRYR